MPELNAAFNSISVLLLVLGYGFIRQRNVVAHRICMMGAALSSALFLAGYLYYHWHHGSTRFQGTGLIRPVYFTILISHTILAAVQVPLIAMTLFFAIRDRMEAHRRIARWTLPIWLYVSITGVVIYWLLYQTTY